MPEFPDEDVLVEEPAEGQLIQIKDANKFPDASLPERQAAVTEHLAKVHSICPYAKLTAQSGDIDFFPVRKGMSLDPLPVRRYLTAAMEKFCSHKKSVFILLLEDNFETHSDAHDAAKRFFLELFIACGKLAFRGISEFQMEALCVQLFREELINIDSKIAEPLLPFRNGKRQRNEVSMDFAKEDQLFVFMMNNLYPESHPRYSPFPIMVVTFGEDLQRVLNEQPALAARMTVNATIGIAHPYIKDHSISELRKGSNAEMVYDNGERVGFFPKFHPAISPILQTSILMTYKKGLYEFPFGPAVEAMLRS